MMLAAYRAYFLSHINYSAVILTSVSSAAMKEIESLNSRLWRIMGISNETAQTNKLVPIDQFIENVCERTLTRILADPNHPITINLPRNQRPDSKFEFLTRRARKAPYGNSFLQKFLRKLRNKANNQSTRASLYIT
jgi:hypothetical protein